uniref:DUF4283 domain-containing protein n=1 Tax=Cannabis sativa TaxID=3483 RepID=A0A803QBB3_CANSA
MRNPWIIRAPITFSNYGNGMFMVEFGCEGDMQRVIEGQPWHFDHCLVTSANPAGLDTLLPNQLRYSPFWIQAHSIPFGMKSYKLAKLIGNEVGDFLEVDKTTLLKVSNLFLRVRVLLDVSKPIPRGSSSSGTAIRRDEAISQRFLEHNPISTLEFSTFERITSVQGFNPGLCGVTPFGVHFDASQATPPTIATVVHTPTDIEPETVQDIARTSEKSKGKAIAGAKRSAFIPHSIMVGDSLRNILKRARASPVINEVPSVVASSFEQAGAAEQPRPKK